MPTGAHAAVSQARAQMLDLVERAAWTFVQAFIAAAALILVTTPMTGWSDAKDVGYSALVAGIAAGLSAIKVLIAQRFGNGTGATLPASVEASLK